MRKKSFERLLVAPEAARRAGDVDLGEEHQAIVGLLLGEPARLSKMIECALELDPCVARVDAWPLGDAQMQDAQAVQRRRGPGVIVGIAAEGQRPLKGRARKIELVNDPGPVAGTGATITNVALPRAEMLGLLSTEYGK